MTKYVTLLALAISLHAADFSLTIGNPSAAMSPGATTAPLVKKEKMAAVLAVRAEGCADPATVVITGTAEGLVDGVRSSVPLMLVPGSAPGSYIVSQEWPPQGAWVVSLTGVCAKAKAGAIIPINPIGTFNRESSKFFPRAAKAAEIEASLKSLAGGAK
jgi:hypothetical protein